MEIVVQKFGGTSVSSKENLLKVSKHIIKEYNKGNQVVVVVSAQGKTTDKLVKEGLEISKDPSEREMDVLLSTGEQITIAKLAILLNNLGYKAKSFTGWQLPILTDNVNENATIKSIDNTKIKEALNDKYIVIVAGFQGIDDGGNITTLGRGGSDTTAVALASSLNAKKVEIYTDVDGVYSCDPNIIKDAKKIENISYDDMLELSNAGAKVLHNRSIEIGKKHKIPIIVKSTFLEDSSGTVISDEKSKDIDDKTIVGIAKINNLTKISIVSKKIIDNGEIIKRISNILDNNKVNIYAIKISNTTISIILDEKVSNKVIEDIHNKFF